MAKGIIYVMTTAVPGLIKIGKTGSNNFEQRMYNLEHDGYRNVAALKRLFAIEVEDYDEKELLLDLIFSKSRLENTELFAIDSNIVVQLLSAFDGKQIYPKNISKEEVFDEASNKRGAYLVPNGEYYLNRKVKVWGNKACTAKMRVKDGQFTVLPGAAMCPIRGKGWTTTKIVDEKRATTKIENDILMVEETFDSPSLAAAFVTFAPANGWIDWKTKDGRSIDIFRESKK